jgi:hypothetical protein
MASTVPNVSGVPTPGPGHLHEAAHAVMAWSLTPEMGLGSHEIGAVDATDRAGLVRFVVPSGIGSQEPECRHWAGQLVIRLAGYLQEERAEWPPDYDTACMMRTTADENLGRVIEWGEISEPAYYVLVALAHVIHADPEYQAQVRSTARLLAIFTRPISGPELEALQRSRGA